MHDRGTTFFIDLESAVWDALVRGDADADRALLSEDFIGVFPTGFANRADHTDDLADGPSIASYAITDARLIDVSADAALLCYRAEYRQPSKSTAEVMFISSLWVQREGRWWNTFSQDTPAASTSA
ncbi:nuclear transport factor 2 family protein [Microbacterium sp. SS28]|uniref:nuclear transport factor 2 family protein n=1 Tax=Microbacterium sp. SS28 TaxID=2919948 RepID=UPI001FAB12C3|nr:nuclear transport factor 2 family protein [Microbacterium sp. SS28]